MSVENIRNQALLLTTQAAQPESHCPIKQIPFELHLQCFSYLNARDLSQASCVNKRWHILSKSHLLFNRLVTPFPWNPGNHPNPFAMLSKTPWILRIAPTIQKASYIQAVFDSRKEVKLITKKASKPRFIPNLSHLSSMTISIIDTQNNEQIECIAAENFIALWDSEVLVLYDTITNSIQLQNLNKLESITNISLPEEVDFIFKMDVTTNQHFLLLPISRVDDSQDPTDYLCFDLKRLQFLAISPEFNQVHTDQKIICNNEATFQLTNQFLTIKPFSDEKETSFQFAELLKESGITVEKQIHHWKPKQLLAFENTVIAQMDVTAKEENLLYFVFDAKTQKLMSTFKIASSNKQPVPVAHSNYLLAYCNQENNAIEIRFLPTGQVIRKMALSPLLDNTNALPLKSLHFKEDQTLLIQDQANKLYAVAFD